MKAIPAEGIVVKTAIIKDSNRFAVDVEAYQFRPKEGRKELQVKTMVYTYE